MSSSSDRVDAGQDNDEPDARGESRQDHHRFTPPVMTDAEFSGDRYTMGREERGVALIINNRKFHSRTGMGERRGTDVDAEKMKSLLMTLGFKRPEVLPDLKVEDMKRILREVAKDDHTNRDCFVCVILSHGEEGYVFGTDDKVPIDELTQPFKGNECTSLAGKPKLFFIQACKGQPYQFEIDHDGGEESEEEVIVRRIPAEADFLIAYSVVPGYLAWSDPAHDGSWFIQAIYDVFRKNWRKLDVVTMMTRVIKKVAIEFESKAKDKYMQQKKQIPYITSLLTKDLFF